MTDEGVQGDFVGGPRSPDLGPGPANTFCVISGHLLDVGSGGWTNGRALGESPVCHTESHVCAKTAWREKEAAPERRRRKRGRPACEAATSVGHTSQSVCAPNQESHRERLEGRRFVSHEAQWPRTRRRPGSWCWGCGIDKHASEDHNTDEKTRAERSACIVPQSKAPRH